MRIGDPWVLPFEPGPKAVDQWRAVGKKGLFDIGFVVEKTDASGQVTIVPVKAGELELPDLEGVAVDGTVVARIEGRSISVEGAAQIEVPEALPARELGLPISVYACGILALVALVAALIWLAKWSQRRKRAPIAAVPRPTQSPSEMALAALACIEVGGGSKEFKQQYFRVSEILKEFLGQTLQFSALESTDEEVLREVSTRSPQHLPALRALFLTLDWTKYTDALPNGADLVKVIEEARQVIRAF